MRIINTAFLTDGYKPPHIDMQVEGTTYVCSNFTPRSDKIFRKTHKSPFYEGKLVVYGIRSAVLELTELWDEGFFKRPFEEVQTELEEGFTSFYGGRVVSIEPLLELHKLGYLPIRVSGILEGSLVPMGVPVMVIESTDPDFIWVVNYIEQLISSLVWKSMTNATIAFEYRKIFEYYAKKTGVDQSFAKYQGIDFSGRGMSGPEDAIRSGAAHLTSLYSSDTIASREYIKKYYDTVIDDIVCVRATEHAIATANILFNAKQQGDDNLGLAEETFVKRLLERYPTGRLGFVADSFGFWRMINEILPKLRPEIEIRGEGPAGPGVVLVRPDSGDPVRILAGYSPNEVVEITDDTLRVIATDKLITRYEYDGAVAALGKSFGVIKNQEGFYSLNPCIRMIYGDSISLERANEILKRLMDKGYASDNVLFGIGSYAYQCNTRDTFGFAIKVTFAKIQGLDIDIYKDPDTAEGSKKSAKGLVDVVYDPKTDTVKPIEGVPYRGGAYRPLGMIQNYPYLPPRGKMGSFQEIRFHLDAVIRRWLKGK